MSATGSTLSHLECSVCHRRYAARQVHNLCACGNPLLVRYDLAAARRTWSRGHLDHAPRTMWRYAPVLPPADTESIVTLGEGMTPLRHATRLGVQLGMPNLWVKDEGLNPTASFKARGLSCAVTMMRELGLTRGAIPSAGNAAGAFATYAAAAGIEAHIFVPRDTPQANIIECQAAGADVTLVDGLISDCGRIVAQRAPQEHWFDVSTLKEPYRIEGKKTMGYELAEQLHWRLPDAVLYPAGGGVGLIGMWKAFAEMEELGWIGPERPKMIAVQVEHCQPVVRAFEEGAELSRFWDDAHTVASGLRVPKPLGDRLMLQAIRASNGVALAVPDSAMMQAALQVTRTEGIFAAPEGGACIAALPLLIEQGVIEPDDTIVAFNTGSGLKYLEAFAATLSEQPPH